MRNQNHRGVQQNLQRQQPIGQQQPRNIQNYPRAYQNTNRGNLAGQRGIQQNNIPQMYNNQGRIQPHGQNPNMLYNSYTRQYYYPYIPNGNQMIPCSKYCTRVPSGNPMIPYSNPNVPNGNPNVPNGAYLYPARNNPQAQMSPQNINDQMVPNFSSLRIAPSQLRYQPKQSRRQKLEPSKQRTGDTVEFGTFIYCYLTFINTFNH